MDSHWHQLVELGVENAGRATKASRQYGAWTPLSAEAQMDLQRVLDLRTVTNRPYPALRTGRH